jgi:hypothetical protein
MAVGWHINATFETTLWGGVNELAVLAEMGIVLHLVVGLHFWSAC